MSGAFPKVYVIYDTKTQKENEVSSRVALLKNRDVLVELIAANVKEEWEEQYRLISIGKNIIKRLKTKVI